MKNISTTYIRDYHRYSCLYLKNTHDSNQQNTQILINKTITKITSTKSTHMKDYKLNYNIKINIHYINIKSTRF